jgi:hypothetical protein
VVLRCVIPNTVEANSANNTAALKCESVKVTVFSPARCDGHRRPR